MSIRSTTARDGTAIGRQGGKRFHILLHVPVKQELSDDEVKRRAGILYGKKKYALMVRDWEMWTGKGRADRVKAQLDAFRARMYDVSEFMKTFKQRFSIYYNANHDRRGAGPLWHDRFKSVLLEESEGAQATLEAASERGRYKCKSPSHLSGGLSSFVLIFHHEKTDDCNSVRNCGCSRRARRRTSAVRRPAVGAPAPLA